MSHRENGRVRQRTNRKGCTTTGKCRGPQTSPDCCREAISDRREEFLAVGAIPSTVLRIRLIFPRVRYALQLLTPANILASLAGRSQIEAEDISEMNELFLDAKTSASLIQGSALDSHV